MVRWSEENRLPTNDMRTLPARAPARAIQSLIIDAIEWAGDPGQSAIVAFEGVNKGRHWRLSLQDAALASRSGMYHIQVQHEGVRYKVSFAGDRGAERLILPANAPADLLHRIRVLPAKQYA